jgi:hypothetical protein
VVAQGGEQGCARCTYPFDAIVTIGAAGVHERPRGRGRLPNKLRLQPERRRVVPWSARGSRSWDGRRLLQVGWFAVSAGSCREVQTATDGNRRTTQRTSGRRRGRVLLYKSEQTAGTQDTDW